MWNWALVSDRTLSVSCTWYPVNIIASNLITMHGAYVYYVAQLSFISTVY